MPKIKEDGVNIIITFVISVIIFQSIFFRESIMTNIRVVFGFYISFVIPGYIFMSIFSVNSFVERFIIGIGAGLAITGIVSYYIKF